MKKGTVGKATKKTQKRTAKAIPEDDDENMDNEDEMALMDQANMGAQDQEQLTNEQKEKQIIKTLSSNNP